MSNLNQFLPGKMQNIAMWFPSSASFTVTYTGKYRLTAVGAGGSGASAQVLTTGGAASGGGGGAFCEKEVDLVAADVLTLVVGAGGTAVSSAGADGVDGGESSIHGAGSAAAVALNMHAGPGLKGLYTVTNAQNKAGGAGGTATGGDLNSTGGAGGAATHLTNGAEAGGGGAAGSPYGTGGAGGSAINGGAAGLLAGGGGGVGGKGWDVTAANEAGSAGGSGGAATALSTGGVSRIPGIGATGWASYKVNNALVLSSPIDPFRFLDGIAGVSPAIPAPGGGNAGSITAAGVKAGYLGGSGGVVFAAAVVAGSGSLGGGSGGRATIADVSGSSLSGVGGPGVILIERIG